MSGEFIARHPFERGATEWLWLPLQQAAEKELQVDRLVGVSMRQALEQRANFNFDAKFLVKLTRKALLEGFAGFAFAAGEFPQSAKVRVGMALSDEQFARAKNETGADFDGLSRVERRGSMA